MKISCFGYINKLKITSCRCLVELFHRTPIASHPIHKYIYSRFNNGPYDNILKNALKVNRYD